MKTIVIGDTTFILRDKPFKCIKTKNKTHTTVRVYFSHNTTIPELSLTFEFLRDCSEFIRFLYGHGDKTIYIKQVDNLVTYTQLKH